MPLTSVWGASFEALCYAKSGCVQAKVKPQQGTGDSLAIAIIHSSQRWLHACDVCRQQFRKVVLPYIHQFDIMPLLSNENEIMFWRP